MPKFEVLASHAEVDGKKYKAGETVECEHDLDKMFANKFRRLSGATRRPTDRDDRLNQSAGRQGDRPDTAHPTPGRSTAGSAPQAGRTAKVPPKDHDFMNMELQEGKEGEEGKEEEVATDYHDKPAPTSDTIDKGDHPVRTTKGKVEEEPDDDDDQDEDEEEEEESKFGEKVTDLFEGAEESGFEVFHDTEDKKYTVVKADKPGKAVNREELKTKQSVKKFLRDQTKE